LGLQGLANLLRFAYEQGITFWDAADQYGSHPHLREALRGLDRSSVVITTKTVSRDRRGTEQDLLRFCRELGTDYLDVVLLHCLTQADWPKSHAGAMEALSAAKERGLVRAVGISSHSLGALRVAVESPWVEVILVRLNYAGVRLDGPLSQVVPLLERGHAAGKGLYAMKVLGCGDLVAEVPRALRYVCDLSYLDAAVVGFVSEEEVRQVVSEVKG